MPVAAPLFVGEYLALWFFSFDGGIEFIGRRQLTPEEVLFNWGPVVPIC